MQQPTIGLSILVKDEAPVITRLLNSVYKHIDYWVIVDTGSTDGTQSIITNFFKDKSIPGELIQTSWVDYSTCRNIALEAIEKVTDYAFSIDADEELITLPGFDIKGELRKGHDRIYLKLYDNGAEWSRDSIWRCNKGFRWQGPVHEFLAPAPKSVVILSNAYALYTQDGNTWKEGPAKYIKQAKILEEYTKTDKGPRWINYTAYCYMRAGEYESAFQWYKKRSEIPIGPPDEYYHSKYYLGWLSVQMKKKPAISIVLYLEAHKADNQRADPIYRIISLLQKIGAWEEAYKYSKIGLRYNLNPPLNGHAIQSHLYNYKMIEVHSINCLYTNRMEEGRKTYYQLRKQIQNVRISPEERRQIISNEKFFLNQPISI